MAAAAAPAARPRRRAPLSSVSALLGTSGFIIDCVANAVITVAINAAIDYYVVGGRPEVEKGELPPLLHLGTIVDVLMFTTIMATLQFAQSGKHTDAIKGGKDAPLATVAVGTWKLLGLIPGAPPLGREGKRRYVSFLTYCLLLPGCTCFALILGSCYAYKTASGDSFGGATGTQLQECRVPLVQHVAWTEAWKCFVAVWVHAMNYVAAHDDRQAALAAPE